MRTDGGWLKFYAAGWLISAGVMAVAFRMWRLNLREAEQRAEEAERTRDEAAGRQAAEERLRIARELHDSLTHSISVIQVQSGVAVHLARKRGEEVAPALLAIQEASTDATRELRATLTVLRDQDCDDAEGGGLGQLDSLVARARSAGLPVTVTVTGAQRRLPSDVDRAAYRIVQEALTNVSRHAGRSGAAVQLGYAQDCLTVRITDDGPGGNGGPGPDDGTGVGTVTGDGTVTGGATGAAGHGLGLIGMRERVSALGGRLHAGPREAGGFEVRAELPVRAKR
jgi:signal transduction histidine kinase